MPLVEFALGGFQRLAPILLRQLQKLLAVVLQGGGGRVPEGFGQLRVLVGQRLDQFLELLVPLVQLPLGGFQGAAEVFFGQVQELLVVVLQCFGGGQFGGLAELGLGRFQQIVGRSRPLQPAVQDVYLGVEAGYFLGVADLGVGGRLVALGLQSGKGSLVGDRLGRQAAFGAELLHKPAGRAADQQTDDDADNPFHLIKPPVGKSSGLARCDCSTTGRGAPASRHRTTALKKRPQRYILRRAGCSLLPYSPSFPLPPERRVIWRHPLTNILPGRLEPLGQMK